MLMLHKEKMFLKLGKRFNGIISIRKLTSYQTNLANDAKIHEVETEIFRRLKTKYKRYYVPIYNSKYKIWTLEANPTGDNTPIVLIHGFFACIPVWRYNIDALSESRPLYAIDLLGFGRSSRANFSKDPLKAEHQFVESIEAWRKQTKLEKFVLLGHSFGGYLSASYTLRYPQHICGLILNDPWGFNDSATEKLLSQIKHFIETTYRHTKSKFPLKNALSLLDSLLIIKYYFYADYFKGISGNKAFESILNMDLFLTSKYPLINRIDKIDQHIPIWFLHGANSFIKNPYDRVASLRSDSSKTYFKEIQNAGHNLHLDNPEDFNQYVQSILKHIDKTYKCKNT